MANNFFSDYPVTGGGGVTSLNGETGALTLTSTGNTIAITTPTASTINLEVTGGTAVTSIGPFGSTPNADGGSISSGVLTLQPADGTHPGGVSTTTQTFAGIKTFANATLFSDGTASNPGIAFSSGTNYGLYRADASDISMALAGYQACSYLNAAGQAVFGFNGTAGPTAQNPWSININYAGTAYFQYNNENTGTTSATVFEILNGSPSLNNATEIGNASNTTSGYLAGGSWLSATLFQTQLNIMSESSSGYIAFNVGGRTLAKEQMRLTGTALTLNNGNSLVMNGSSTGAVTIATQAAAGTFNFNLPITAGTSGYVLTSAGGGSSPMTWTQVSGSSSVPLAMFGDGSDGAATLDGVNTYGFMSLTGSTYTLLRTVDLTNLTVNSGKTLVIGPFIVFGTGTLTNAGTISNNGTAGGAGGIGGQGNAGTAGVGGGPIPGGATGGAELLSETDGTIGAAGAVTAGTAGNPGGSNYGPPSVVSGDSGNGGNGTSGSGGTGAAAGPVSTPFIFRRLANNFVISTGSGTASVLTSSGSASAGGASGAGDGVNNGGGGGGGGGCGGTLPILFNTINNTGTISATGGAGGAGESPAAGNVGGGGGGGGGSGGWIYVIANTWTATGTFTASGGAAGAKGNHHGSGTDGTAGTSGTSGTILRYNPSGGWF